jgi:hypothetical protein
MKRGFTLIEMLAASALTALLMITMVAVIASVARSDLAAARRAAANPWPPDLVKTLRDDLLNSRTLRCEPVTLTMEGFASIDPMTLRPTHRQTQVRYAVQSIAGRNWLIRKQREHSGDQHESSFLVCPDVQSIAFETRPPATQRMNTGGEEEIPARLRLIIRSTLPGVHPIDELMVLQ